MRILMLGKMSSWMGLHFSHIQSAFQHRGHEVLGVDYHRMVSCWIPLSKAMEDEWRQRALEKIVRSFAPDLIYCLASWKYDFQRLKSYYKGLVAIHDLDGPRRLSPYDQDAFSQVDLPLTASKYMVRHFAEKGIRLYYLPSAVDTAYYAPMKMTEKERKAFSAPFSYIGRATERRAEYCKHLVNKGIALYGNRWKTNKSAISAGLGRCVRLKRDVKGLELVKIYQCSTAVLNIQQEPLDQFRSILSLQCFAVPATGGCLIADYVEEADEAFEIGKEILVFRTKEELLELSEKCVKDPAFARSIGEAGRIRCQKCHTHEKRVTELEGLLSSF